ncbi:MAG TPA: ClbS/DfsB family four-helix bundle protein [Ktedonobacteraceae bacterium]|nr:ClbS/DfsB family four-helix bundle protein [Ktedonobacteraceae bacterium]
MGTTISKTQFLAELNDENAYWQALLDDIGEVNMTQPEVAGGWSIKDIVAHLTGWRRRAVRRFRAILNHEPGFTPPWPSELREDDEINAWIYEANRDRPLADVLSDSREVFQQLLDVIAAFPDDEFQGLQRSEWLQGETLSGKLFFAHFHEEHEPDMRAWLDRVRKGS